MGCSCTLQIYSARILSIIFAISLSFVASTEEQLRFEILPNSLTLRLLLTKSVESPESTSNQLFDSISDMMDSLNLTKLHLAMATGTLREKFLLEKGSEQSLLTSGGTVKFWARPGSASNNVQAILNACASLMQFPTLACLSSTSKAQNNCDGDDLYALECPNHLVCMGNIRTFAKHFSCHNKAILNHLLRPEILVTMPRKSLSFKVEKLASSTRFEAEMSFTLLRVDASLPELSIETPSDVYTAASEILNTVVTPSHESNYNIEEWMNPNFHAGLKVCYAIALSKIIFAQRLQCSISNEPSSKVITYRLDRLKGVSTIDTSTAQDRVAPIKVTSALLSDGDRRNWVMQRVTLHVNLKNQDKLPKLIRLSQQIPSFYVPLFYLASIQENGKRALSLDRFPSEQKHSNACETTQCGSHTTGVNQICESGVAYSMESSQVHFRIWMCPSANLDLRIPLILRYLNYGDLGLDSERGMYLPGSLISVVDVCTAESTVSSSKSSMKAFSTNQHTAFTAHGHYMIFPLPDTTFIFDLTSMCVILFMILFERMYHLHIAK